MLVSVLLSLSAYLVGSVPSGYILVRARRGLDVRDYGSCSVGAINVVRVGGLALGLVTLAADAGKALVMVLVAAALKASPWAVSAVALSVMLGHTYSLWFLLRDRRVSEGKGVACGLGVLIGLALIGVLPLPLALAPLGLWGLGLVAPRVVTGRWQPISPATMVASASIPLAVHAAHPVLAYQVLSVAMALLILVRHRGNLRRLRAGTEPRLGERLPPYPGGEAETRQLRLAGQVHSRRTQSLGWNPSAERETQGGTP